MKLNLLPILNFDGKKIHIDEKVSVSPRHDDTFEICAPVEFDGTVQNVGGTIELCGTAEARLNLICDRCGEEYETTLRFALNESFKKADEFSDIDDNPDISMLEGTSIDLDEIIYTNLFLNLPSKQLCSDDCKGLCPICGANLNKTDCGCKSDATDPRFDILDNLLGK